jgi:hypothetical protein
MPKDELTQHQILGSLLTTHWGDYEFLNKVNDLTYHRKVQLLKEQERNETT